MGPMAEAAYAGQLELVMDLAAHSANLHAESKNSNTPMALAAYAGQLEVMQDLAARNAKYNADNQDGMTPMAEVVEQTSWSWCWA